MKMPPKVPTNLITLTNDLAEEVAETLKKIVDNIGERELTGFLTI